MNMAAIVIHVLFAVIFVISLVTAERVLYFYFRLPRDVRDINCVWAEHRTRGARLRLWCLLRYRACTGRLLWLVRALVLVCPLLGMLGTVSGVSRVFDIVLLHGGVAAGMVAPLVAAAMMPALTGMAALLAGLACTWGLRRCVARGQQELRMI